MTDAAWQRLHRSTGPAFLDLPRGAIVAVGNLVDTRPMVLADEPAALCPHHGKYAWVLNNVRRVRPCPIVGRQGLWTVPPELLLRVDSHNAVHDCRCPICGNDEMEPARGAHGSAI